MRYFLDTEFIESGPTRPIYLLSLGIVAEDGRELYLQHWDVPFGLANDWVKRNVFPHMQSWKQTGDHSTTPSVRWLPDLDGPVWQSRQGIVSQLRDFISIDGKPEFWGYYADYDWVVFCQLFGNMTDLPPDWPMYCRDIKQWCDELGNPKLPKQGKGEHHALADARWNKQAYEFLKSIDPRPADELCRLVDIKHSQLPFSTQK